jgi:hypothetical protein
MTRLSLLIALCLLAVPHVCLAIGQPAFVSSEPEPQSFPVVRDKVAAEIFVDTEDHPGVVRAARDLQADIARVTGITPSFVQKQTEIGRATILIGTIGRSPLIDRLVSDRKLDLTGVGGKWEATVTQVVPVPLPGVSSALVIAGSDKRGTIYGIYDLSEQIGVSPWYWWADVPPRQRDALFVRPGTHVRGPPKVKYRGIFINDEEPCFGPWARDKFGGVNSKLYARVFELILRLRGNYLWPAMWGKAFNEDDPENPRLADEYGVVMGTSHHEPMLRAQQEWKKHGEGEWNYSTNEAVLRDFWRFGVERNRSYESIVTIGMRGDGDEPMVKGGDTRANIALLERIVADQRKLIAETVNADVPAVPQLWALYKEVADFYEHGMRVPDDVTLLWCDDNWGNVRRLPTPEERKRAGGAGIYYHFDYVGGPRSYKWINTNPLPKVWEQMNLAYRHGADRIWIVNVGDLKPMELPIEFFLTLAWDPDAMPKEGVAGYTRQWASREFGPEHADAIADIVSRYAKYNAWRKPELLEPTTFSLLNYSEAERVEAAWDAITAEAERIYAALAPRYRDAFYQLVLYPTKASGTVAKLYLASGRNRLYAKQGRASTNEQGARVRELFKQDQELSDYFNDKLAGGKWKHMMAQTRIGYTSWSDPKTNVMPKVTELEVPERAQLGVAIEGSESAWPGGADGAKLPPFDSINRQRRWIDVFNRGSRPFDYAASADCPWIKLSESSGVIGKDRRLWVTIDWDAVPIGEAKGTVAVSGPGGTTVQVGIETVRSTQFTRDQIGAFGGLTGPVAIDAEHATNSVEAAGVRWEKIPDYGRGPSGVSIFPVTAPSVTPQPHESPRLEYKIFLPHADDYHVKIVTGPTLNFLPGRGLRLAISFDHDPPQVLDAFDKQAFADPALRRDLSSPAIRDWATWVRDNARVLTSSHKISQPGVHTLNLWMIDSGVVVQGLVIHRGQLPPSYFGPPTSSTQGP